MPIKPSLGLVVNTVFLVRAAGPWRERLAEALQRSSAASDHEKIPAHLALIERRLAGELDWERALGGGPAASRAYTAMLKQEGGLPLYHDPPLVFSADLFNPNDEGNDPAHYPDLIAIELLIHRDFLNPWLSGRLHDGTPIDYGSPACYGRMVAYGERFGRLVETWAETLAPVFAFADIQNTGAFMRTRTSPASVRNPAPAGTPYWAYLWPLTYWSPELLNERLEARLTVLALSPDQLAAIDPFERTGIRPTWRRLATGGLLVQYRFIFGTEGRASRTRVDTPLARQAGLRTTSALWRG
jgi:hypothetical protein